MITDYQLMHGKVVDRYFYEGRRFFVLIHTSMNVPDQAIGGIYRRVFDDETPPILAVFNDGTLQDAFSWVNQMIEELKLV